MKSVFGFGLILPTIVLLSACGGGETTETTGTGTTGTGTSGTTTTSYLALANTSPAISTLSAVGIQTNSGTGARSITNSSNGQYNHATQTATLPTGGTTTATTGFTGYSYLTTFDQTYTAGGITYDVSGVMGINTATTDMPTSGTASYTGGARGVIVSGSNGYDLNSGTSQVDVNFGTSSVNVSMTNFTTTDQVTGNAATAPADTISVTGMSIAGSNFSGGILSVTNGGASVDLTGTNTTTSAMGSFFGYDTSTMRPSEVGGVVYSAGDNGTVAMTFVGK